MRQVKLYTSSVAFDENVTLVRNGMPSVLVYSKLNFPPFRTTYIRLT